MSNRTKFIISTMSLLAPSLAFADIAGTITKYTTIVTQQLPAFFFGLAVVYFFWGLGSYAFGVDDKTKAQAKTTMIYGIIILFVMSSIWGLVAFLRSELGISGDTSGTVPRIN